MTWGEFKKAVEELGVNNGDFIQISVPVKRQHKPLIDVYDPVTKEDIFINDTEIKIRNIVMITIL